MGDNLLYYGDNLDILQRYIKDESLDLIYLDPPFKSNQDYNVLFLEQDGSRSKAQIKAFEDTWRWDQGAAKAYHEIVESGGRISEAMQAFHTYLGDNDMMAYLAMMAPRLVELRRVLKSTGSIYLHCDPTASHYLKILMDSIFSPQNFCNEIIWHYRKWPGGKYAFQRNHDVLFFYSKSKTEKRIFNQLYMDRAASTLKRFGKAKIVSGYDDTGRRIPSKMEDEESLGVRQDDVWDIGRVPPIKQLFPTEKPFALLERIIQASSIEGATVLDPFCGCGTTVVAAHKLKRHWIGIDVTHLAVGLIKHRLYNDFSLLEKRDYQVIGEPTDLSGAKKLAEDDRFQFQCWALGKVGARSADTKKGSDRGIDGRLYFHDDPKGGKTKQIIFSVKSGGVSVKDVRDLRGVIEREEAEIGVLITLEKPTGPMKREVASKGFYKTPWGNHPRMQVLTIEQLLTGKRVDYPAPSQANVTFKKTPKEKTPLKTRQTTFTFEEDSN